MTPAIVNLTLTAGDGYSHEFTFTDGTSVLDVSAYTHRAQIRSKPAAIEAVDFTIDETSAATGVVTVSLTAAQTRLLASGVWQWDMERELDGAYPQTVLAGTLRVTPDITREAVTP